VRIGGSPSHSAITTNFTDGTAYLNFGKFFETYKLIFEEGEKGLTQILEILQYRIFLERVLSLNIEDFRF